MITIPSQHYVGVKEERETESSLPLAFATPFGTDAAFEKRKSTVDRWCQGHGKYVDGKYVYPDINTKVMDNGLMSGFRIAESVRRIGWNGGNVVWRIVDPRGFELEISSANFARVIDCTTIENGEIKGKCIWGRDGAANVLLPESSEPYQQATANTRRASMKVDAKSLAVGDEVEFKNGDIMVYMGPYTILSRKETRHQNPGYGSGSYYSYAVVAKKRHVFGKRIDKEYAIKRQYHMDQVGRKEGDWSYYIVSDIKNVAAITTKSAAQVDQESIADDITTQLEKYSNCIDSASNDWGSFAAIPGTVKVQDLVMTTEVANQDDPADRFTKIVHHNGIWYYMYASGSYLGANWNLCSTTLDLSNHTYTQNNRVATVVSPGDMQMMTTYNFVITHKGKQYRF